MNETFAEKAHNQKSAPTKDQIEVLEMYGIRPSATLEGCAKMIRYIVKGNGIPGETAMNRAVLLKDFQQRLLEMSVNFAGTTYRIKELFPINPGDKYSVQDEAMGHTYPFAARIDCGEYEMEMPFSALPLAVDQIQ